MNPDAKKKVVGGMVAIGVGVIGSAAWDVMKPILGWSWNWLLAISTLGIQSLKDNMYAKSARGVEYLVVNHTTTTVLFGCTATMGMICALAVLFSDRSKPIPFKRGILMGSGICLFMTMFALIQIMQLTYVLELSRYRTQLETLAAVQSSDAEIRSRSAKALLIKSKATYLLYVNELKAKIPNGYEAIVERDFF